jgi:hypothetical protein
MILIKNDTEIDRYTIVRHEKFEDNSPSSFVDKNCK